MDITFVIGNNSWKFCDDTMTGTYWKRCDRQTDRQTGGQTERGVLRAAWSQLKTLLHYTLLLTMPKYEEPRRCKYITNEMLHQYLQLFFHMIQAFLGIILTIYLSLKLIWDPWADNRTSVGTMMARSEFHIFKGAVYDGLTFLWTFSILPLALLVVKENK